MDTIEVNKMIKRWGEGVKLISNVNPPNVAPEDEREVT